MMAEWIDSANDEAWSGQDRRDLHVEREPAGPITVTECPTCGWRHVTEGAPSWAQEEDPQSRVARLEDELAEARAEAQP